MSRYADAINAQITLFETPQDLKNMDNVELDAYKNKMLTVGYKINVYGPERCAKFRQFAVDAESELDERLYGEVT